MTTPLLSGRLTPRVTVITGSSSGVGRACALAFAANGACPIICSDLRPEARGEWGLAEAQVPTHELICQRYGQGKAVFVQCDVTVAEQVAHLIQKAVEVGGRLDVYLLYPLLSVMAQADDHNPSQHNQQRGNRRNRKCWQDPRNGRRHMGFGHVSQKSTYSSV